MSSSYVNVTAVDTSIDKCLWHLNDLDELIGNFDTSRSELVQQKVVDILQTLLKLNTQSEGLEEVCPAQLLQWIDDGKDGDAFVKALFQETLTKHQVRCPAGLQRHLSGNCTRGALR